jgi:hypothetical protein
MFGVGGALGPKSIAEARSIKNQSTTPTTPTTASPATGRVAKLPVTARETTTLSANASANLNGTDLPGTTVISATASTTASATAAVTSAVATSTTSTTKSTLTLPITIPLAQAALSTKAIPTDTKDYRNVRVGYVIAVPTVLTPEPEFANRDGRMFRSPDGGVVLSVHGGLAQPGTKPWSGTEPGDKVTYFARLPGGWVKSGTRNEGKTRWYSRLRSDAVSFAVFSIAYPDNAKDLWSPAAGKINASFSLV